jgi:indolepyruvate ferredoxin oxidoreductase
MTWRSRKAVARYYFKLLAYKDEYEVARLYSDRSFRQQLEAQFEGDYKLQFHLAPAWLAKRDSTTGEPRKRELGPWVLNAFNVLAKLKFLRGTPLDVFGYGHDRRCRTRVDQRLRAQPGQYLAQLKPSNYRTARGHCCAAGTDPRLRPGEGAFHRQSAARRSAQGAAEPRRRGADRAAIRPAA